MIVLGFASAMAGVASAAPTWLPETGLSGAGVEAQAPSVAVDSEGEALAVWQQPNGTTLEASIHPPDGSWRSPITIASDASGGGQVAFDADGDATVIWPGTSNVVESATLPAGATTWTKPVTISPTGASSPALAVDSQGDAVAVWTVPVTAAATTTVVQAAFRPAATTTWGSAIQLSTTPTTSTPTTDIAATPQVALDPHGDAVAAWVQTVGTSPSGVWAASRPVTSGVWQSAVTVSDSTMASGGAEVALDPAGRATAIWSDSAGIGAADLPLGGAWSSPVTVPGSAGGFNPSLAIDAQGDATAVFNQSVGNGVGPAAKADAVATARPAGGAWQTPVVISTQNPVSGHAPGPQVGVDPHGDAVAVWTAFDGTNNTAEAATKVAGGTWPAPSAAVTLSGDSMDPQGPALAVDPQGNAAVVWQQIAGGDFQIQAAGYDAAGPLLDRLSIPARAVAGTPVAFSVTPVDAWSPVSSTTWSFGDGQSGSGETLTHTYANPGSYKVTVTSTDGLGNPNTGTGTITIAPHSSPAPPPSAPKLSQVSQSHRKWREGSKPATIARKQKSKRPPVGTSFSFTVNEAARVTLAFTQSNAGRKVKGKCRAPNKPNRKHPSCQRTVTRATLGFSVSAGHHAIKFQGHAGKKKIPLGAYTLKLTAINATQQHSRTATLKFTIVK
jgi:hypothetical protein